MTDTPLQPQDGFGDDEIPGVFVPHGQPVPPHAQGPDWVLIPAWFIPHGTEAPPHLRGPDWIRVPARFTPQSTRRTPGGQVWPTDRNGRDWPKDRFGRPICPLWDYPPGVRAPGEGPPTAPAPPFQTVAETIAEYQRIAAIADDPANVMRLLQWAAGQGQAAAPPANAPVQSAPTAMDRTEIADSNRAPATEAGPDPAQSAGPPPQDAPRLSPPPDRRAKQTPVSTSKVYDIFIGGAAGQSHGHSVLNYESSYESSHNAKYFTWDAQAEILRYIATLPPDATVNLIGHSWGGDTAAKVALRSPRRTNLLITIDPVSHDPPNFAAVAQHVQQWIDVDAMPSPQTAKSDTGSNTVAGFGGAWNARPQTYAHVFIPADANHSEFSTMMRSKDTRGRSPEQKLKEQ